MMRFVVVAVVALAAACGASTEPVVEATATPTQGEATNAKEKECLALAATRPKARSDQPSSVKVSHVLVHHSGSKNPRDGVTRTRGEACLRAAEARDKLLASAPFEEIVATYSDEAGAASRAGMLGDMTREQLDPVFADVAFDLSRGQMSDVVETPFGFHLILRND